MKKILAILFTSISFCLTLTNCTNLDSSSSKDNYPLLKIVCNYSGCITRVGLVGYTFENLRILKNESKTFDLVDGIPGGYDNVNVNISFKPIVSGNDKAADSRSPISVRCNFTKGKTTTITLLDGSLGTNIINVSY